MTIASQTSRISYTGDGSTTAFSVPFYFAANADLVVILADTLGVQTTQVLGTNYTLTGATVSSGGTCTFTTAPTTGYLVTIYRDPPITQTTSYNNNDPFPAKSHETALDKLTTIAQRLKDIYSRSLRLSDGEATITTTLGSVATRKNKLLGFDTTGALTYVVGPTFVGNTSTGVAEVDSRATAQVTTFAASVNIIKTYGRATAGDGGGAEYKRGIVSSPDSFLDGGGTQYWGLVGAITGVVEVDSRVTAATLIYPLSVTVVQTHGLVAAGDGGGADYIRGTISSPGAWLDAGGVYWGFASTAVVLGPPQGRLTLTTGVGVTTSDVTGATSVYFTPLGGAQVPIYNGTSMTATAFTELTMALDSNAGHGGYHYANENFDLFVINDSGTIRLGTGPGWALGAVAGSATARGTGVGSTELQLISGLWTNKNTITIRFGSANGNTVSIAANKATYLGTMRTTAAGVTEDSLIKRFLYNAYNQAKRSMLRQDATASWAYSTATYRQANNSASNQLAYIAGLAGSALDATAHGIALNSTATPRIVYTGIGLDSTTANSRTTGDFTRIVDGTYPSPNPKAQYSGACLLGYHYVAWLEKGNGTDTQTWFGVSGSDYQSGIYGSVFN